MYQTNKTLILLITFSFSINFLEAQCDDSDPAIYTTTFDMYTPDYDSGAYENGDAIIRDFDFALTATNGYALADVEAVIYTYTLDGLGLSGGAYLSAPTFSNTTTYNGGVFNDAIPTNSTQWCTGKTVSIDGSVLLTDGTQIPFSVGPMGLCEGGNEVYVIAYIFSCADQDFCEEVPFSDTYEFTVTGYAPDNGNWNDININSPVGFTLADISYVMFDYSYTAFPETGTGVIMDAPWTLTMTNPVALDENGECVTTNGEVVYDGTVVLLDGTELPFSGAGVLLCSGGDEHDNYVITSATPEYEPCDLFTVVPVEFNHFTGTLIENQIQLNWTTLSELNNAGFYIEKSQTTEHWEVLSFVEGLGSSSSSKHYNFIDKEPEFGSNYYRLKQVDFNGAYRYSEIIEIKYNKRKTLAAYPNPVSDILFIESEALETDQFIELFDTNGRIVLEQNLSESKKLDMSMLHAGIYFLQIRNIAGVEKQQITKI